MWVFIVSLAACQSRQSSFIEANFSMWEGRWERIYEGRQSIEIWRQEPDNSFSGLGLMISPGGDTLFQENLFLLRTDTAWVYQAQIESQNQARKISFVLDSAAENYWRFVNPRHDFPQRIVYHLPNPDSLDTEVAGPLGGEWKTRQMGLIRAPKK